MGAREFQNAEHRDDATVYGLVASAALGYSLKRRDRRLPAGDRHHRLT